MTPRAARRNSGIKKERKYAPSAQFLGRRKLRPDISDSRRLLRDLYGTAYRGRTGHLGGGTCK